MPEVSASIPADYYSAVQEPFGSAIYEPGDRRSRRPGKDDGEYDMKKHLIILLALLLLAALSMPVLADNSELPDLPLEYEEVDEFSTADEVGEASASSEAGAIPEAWQGMTLPDMEFDSDIEANAVEEPTAEPTAEPTEDPAAEPTEESADEQTQEPAPAGRESGSQAALWIILAVVVVAAAAAVIIVIKKKRGGGAGPAGS